MFAVSPSRKEMRTARTPRSIRLRLAISARAERRAAGATRVPLPDLSFVLNIPMPQPRTIYRYRSTAPSKSFAVSRSRSNVGAFENSSRWGTRLRVPGLDKKYPTSSITPGWPQRRLSSTRTFCSRKIELHPQTLWIVIPDSAPAISFGSEITSIEPRRRKLVALSCAGKIQGKEKLIQLLEETRNQE